MRTFYKPFKRFEQSLYDLSGSFYLFVELCKILLALAIAFPMPEN